MLFAMQRFEELIFAFWLADLVVQEPIDNQWTDTITVEITNLLRYICVCNRLNVPQPFIPYCICQRISTFVFRKTRLPILTIDLFSEIISRQLNLIRIILDELQERIKICINGWTTLKISAWLFWKRINWNLNYTGVIFKRPKFFFILPLKLTLLCESQNYYWNQIYYLSTISN